MKGIQVPVKPHVLKYLHVHLGSTYQLSESDHFGLFLFQLLRRPLTDSRKDELVAKYTARFAVAWGAYSPHQYGLKNLTGKTVYLFNHFVHELIIAELHAYVEMGTDHGNQTKYCIQCFMLKYGFTDEDIAYDTLNKSWQRFSQEQRQQKKPVVKLSPRKLVRDLQKSLTKAATNGGSVYQGSATRKTQSV